MKPTPDCPTGWTAHDGACYIVRTDKTNWFEAEEQCAKEGAHLASCLSASEYIFLGSLTTSATDYWIGLNEM